MRSSASPTPLTAHSQAEKRVRQIDAVSYTKITDAARVPAG